ncbi:MAG: hypothetical protein WD691_04955 [Acidimicrobiales bacterium]
MPSALRTQVALIGILAVLLIPIGTSSLRGLTHVLTCQELSASPFTVEVPQVGAPSILSSTVIERDPTGAASPPEVCGGLRLDITMGSRTSDRADITLAITNNSDYGWRGSVELELGNLAIPIDIGQIEPGQTVTDQVDLRLDAGRRYEIAGSLLIGP